jgi:hypothetical protein
MLLAACLLVAAFAFQAPADTLRYQVLNHGRSAGSMPYSRSSPITW